MVVNDQNTPPKAMFSVTIYVPDDVTSLARITRESTAAAGTEY